MNKIDFLLGDSSGNYTKVPEPDNWQELEIELSFENDGPEAVLNATKLVWKGTNAQYLYNWVINYSKIFEGVPLRIQVCDTKDLVFDGIIDLSSSDTVINCDIVTATIRDKRMDMVKQLFDSVSFAYLATPVSQGGGGIIKPGIYPNGDYVAVPYQLINIPDYFEALLSSLSILQIIGLIERIVHKVYDIVAVIAGEIAVGAAVFSAAAVLGTAFEMLVLIFEIFVMIYVLIELIQITWNELVGPINPWKKLGMMAHTLCERACTYFGLGFSSTILQSAPYNAMLVLPAKQAWSYNRNNGGYFDKQSGNLKTIGNSLFDKFTQNFGVTALMLKNQRMMYDDETNFNAGGFAYGYFDGTVGDLFRGLSEVFNARAKIILDANGNPVLHFERWDYQYDLSSYQLPNISKDAPFAQPFATNASEVPANYMVDWEQDTADTCTINYYDGTTCYAQSTTFPQPVNLTHNVLQNLTERNIPFARALKKTKFTVPEDLLGQITNILASAVNGFTGVLNDILDAIDPILSLLGLSSPHFATVPTDPFKIYQRLNRMLLSDNITAVPKLIMVDLSNPSNVLLGTYERSQDMNSLPGSGRPNDPLAAQNLMRDFHWSSLGYTTTSPTAAYAKPYPPSTTYWNQYFVYDEESIPVCCLDYELIKNNNYITTYDGKPSKVLSLKWNPFHGTGLINYRVQRQYAQLNVSYVVDGCIYLKKLP